MKFTIDFQHREYFHEHLAIEFEDILSLAQLKQLRAALSSALSERLGIHPGNLAQETAESIFLAGRDLWRAHPGIKRIVLQKRLAEIASELSEQKIIGIGFDEFFPTPGMEMVHSTLIDPYHALLNKQLLLSEICSLQGILCGLMVCLEGEGIPEEEPKQLSAFSRIPGHGVFIHPDFLIDFKELYQRPGHTYLLIVYCQSSTVYIYQEQDPHVHDMKKLKYSFGDKLKEKLNPIIIR